MAREQAHNMKSDLSGQLLEKSGTLFRFGHQLTVVVALLSIAVTFLVWLNIKQDIDEKIQTNFHGEVDEATEMLRARMKAYEHILRGTSGLFLSSRQVTRAEFRAYVSQLDLASMYPGIQAVGFVPELAEREVASYVNRVRGDGIANFTIKQTGLHEYYAPVIYIEPYVGRNLRVLGFDMYSEPTRRAAMEQARDTGEVVMSAKVALAQDDGQKPQAGVLMYQPIYRSGAVIESVAARRSNFVGWVFAAFRINEMLAGLYDKQAIGLGLKIYDSSRVDESKLMFDSAAGEVGPLLYVNKQLTVGQRDWTLQLTPPKDFAHHFDQGKLNMVIYFGLGVSALLTMLVWLLTNAQQLAVRTARQMTQELESSQQQLKETLAELEFKRAALNQHAIVSITDAAGNITFINQKFIDISGYSREELLGKNHRILKSGVHSPEFYDALWATVERGETWHGEVCNRKKDGSLYWVRATIKSQLDENGLPLRYIAIRTDISEIKQAEQVALHSQVLLRSVIDAIPDLIFFKDKDGKYLGCNKAFEHYFGAQEGQILGKTDFDFVDEKTASFFREQDALMLASGQPRMNEETVTYPDGRVAQLEVVKSPYRYGDEAPGVIGIAHEVTERNRQLQALRQSEERWSFAIEGAGDGVWDWDMASGTMQLSHLYEAMLGYADGELPQTIEAWVASVHPEDLARVQQNLQDYLSGATQDYVVELRLQCKSGGYKWVLCRGTVVERDAEGKPRRMIGIHTDIDRRKQGELQLALFGEMVENTAQPIFLIDVQNNYRLGYVNQAACKHWGASKEKLLTWRIPDWDPTFDEEKTSAHFAATVGQPGVMLETEHRLKDGSIVPVEVFINARMIAGKPYIYGSFQNIADRKKAEAALVQLQLHQQRILTSMGEGVHGLGLDGNITFENPAAIAMLGYESAEGLIGQPAHAVMHHHRADGSPYPVSDCHIYATLQDGQMRRVEDEVFWRKDGSCFPVTYVCSGMFDEQGKLEGAIVVFRDSTESKRAEQLLINAREEAIRANKAKSEFLSNMSHELRTPMNAILGFTQLMEGDAGITADQKENLQQISKAGWHLLDLINEVLDLARVESGEVKLNIDEVTTSEIVRECLSLVSPLLAQKQIVLDNQVTQESFKMQADYLRLKQVLINLLSNAIKYNHDGGAVILTVRQEGGEALLSVRDSGRGMTAEQLQRLFEPFTRFGDTERVQGTGIGLSICKKLVERMNGKILVESVDGEGSVFTLVLPLAGGMFGSVVAHHDTAHTVQLLYIEDDPAHQSLIGKWASKLQWQVVFAHDAAMGIDEAMKSRYDAVLLDMDLPGGFTGLDVKAVFNEMESLRSVPVIGISHLTEQQDIDKAMQAGFVAYLNKPVDLAELQRIVRRTIRSGGGL